MWLVVLDWFAQDSFVCQHSDLEGAIFEYDPLLPHFRISNPLFYLFCILSFSPILAGHIVSGLSSDKVGNRVHIGGRLVQGIKNETSMEPADWIRCSTH